jgi:hypothetical protein
MTQIKKITFKEGFIDLYNRMVKQYCEKFWELERVKQLEGDEFYDFVGAGAVKEKVIKKLERELKEREKI